MDVVIKTVLAIVLGLIGIYDLKTMQISIPFLVTGSVILTILLPWNANVGVLEALGGVFIGGAMLVVSVASKGSVGFGDGLVFCMTGICLGFWDNANLIFISFLLAGAFGLVGLGSKRLTKRQRIPFVPFIALGYLGMLCL